jgi:hypothetical protein
MPALPKGRFEFNTSQAHHRVRGVVGFVFALRLAHLRHVAWDAEVLLRHRNFQQPRANVKKCHGSPEATGDAQLRPAIDANLGVRAAVGVIAPKMVKF